MPYKREEAMKFTDHQVQTPIAHVNLSCQTCHNYTETQLQSRVDQIQSRKKGQLDCAEIAVMELIESIKHATDAGLSEASLEEARKLQRRAQWRADLVNAENSMGFHAPGETLRILGESIDFARQRIAEVMRAKASTTSGSKQE